MNWLKRLRVRYARWLTNDGRNMVASLDMRGRLTFDLPLARKLGMLDREIEGARLLGIAIKRNKGKPL